MSVDSEALERRDFLSGGLTREIPASPPTGRPRMVALAIARTVVLAAMSLLAGMSLIASPAGAATLPRSDYLARPACPAPAPGRASCLAVGLEPRTEAARARVHPLTTNGTPSPGIAKANECQLAYDASCLTPQELQSAYFPGQPAQAPAGNPQTVALIDAYNDPNAAGDLARYEAEFGLHDCGEASCFQQVNRYGEAGSLPFPRSKSELEAFAKGTAKQREQAEEAEGWALEIVTDIEVVRAICHDCHILLVEAATPDYGELETAEDTAAVTLHATEISNSWGGPEAGSETNAFDHPGIPITGAAGDDGYLNWDEYSTRYQRNSPYFEGVNFPAASPYVIAVGGTHLTLTPEGSWAAESVWNSEGAGGSGCGSQPAPEWQQSVGDWSQVGCGSRRSSVDVAADADPSTGVDIYDSTPSTYETEAGVKLHAVPDWSPVGGTSVAAPIIAAMFALAGGGHGVPYPAQTLYSYLSTGALHDVTVGGNGACDDDYSNCSGSLSSPLDCGAQAWICNATSGYDGPTGVGTPDGIEAFTPSAESGHAKGSEEGRQVVTVSKSPGGATAPETGGASENSGAETPGSGPADTSKATRDSASKSTPITISALSLTPAARTSLRHGRATLSKLALSFTLSRAALVRVTLAVQARVHGRIRWRTLTFSLSFAAHQGHNTVRLRGSRAMAPGIYRVSITPRGGAPRTLAIHLTA